MYVELWWHIELAAIHLGRRAYFPDRHIYQVKKERRNTLSRVTLVLMLVVIFESRTSHPSRWPQFWPQTGVCMIAIEAALRIAVG